MRQPISNEQLETVLRAVGRHPGGASIDAILAAVRPVMSRRTLQRWLAVLVQDRPSPHPRRAQSQQALEESQRAHLDDYERLDEQLRQLAG